MTRWITALLTIGFFIYIFCLIRFIFFLIFLILYFVVFFFFMLFQCTLDRGILIYLIFFLMIFTNFYLIFCRSVAFCRTVCFFVGRGGLRHFGQAVFLSIFFV